MVKSRNISTYVLNYNVTGKKWFNRLMMKKTK